MPRPRPIPTRRLDPLRLLSVLGVLLVAGLPPSAGAQEGEPPRQVRGLGERPARAADVATIDAIVAAFYDVVSHDAGEPIDWARDSTLYLEGLRFRLGGADGSLQVLDHGAYAAAFSDVSRAFHEREIHRVTQRYGPMAQVFSTYEWSEGAGAAVRGRGINAIELWHDGTRWWIASATWVPETSERPIPVEYLPEPRR